MTPYGSQAQTDTATASVHPSKYVSCCQAVRSIAEVLKPGKGRVFVRDYAQGDLAQQRLSTTGRQQKLATNFYMRMDGTRAFYFSEAGARSLTRRFTEAVLLSCS